MDQKIFNNIILLIIIAFIIKQVSPEPDSILYILNKYINYFVSPTDVSLNGAALSVEEKNIINKSVETINTWNILCEHGVSIAMSENVDVKYIQQASNELKQTTNNLKNATNTLKSKLASYNILC